MNLLFRLRRLGTHPVPIAPFIPDCVILEPLNVPLHLLYPLRLLGTPEDPHKGLSIDNITFGLISRPNPPFTEDTIPSFIGGVSTNDITFGFLDSR